MFHGGKEGPNFMRKTVYGHLGSSTSRVLVGPGKGLDNGVVRLGHGQVMIVTVDPVSAIPAFGMKISAWLSVHLIASDYTASGLDPQFAIFSYNLPPPMSASERDVYVSAIGNECRRLGVTIVAGHTGSYPGSGYTVIGAGAMIGLAKEGGYVTPSMAREGDVVLMTKDAAIEASGSLAASFPNFVRKRLGAAVASKAKNKLKLCTTVNDARTARRIGLGDGVTSMHDATEGGVLGGLDEMASASAKAFEVDLSRIPVSTESELVCGAFGLDPLNTMSEGALLMTCRPEKVSNLEKVMSKAQIQVSVIGSVKGGSGLRLKEGDGRRRTFKPAADRYWLAYDRALEQGLN